MTSKKTRIVGLIDSKKKSIARFFETTPGLSFVTETIGQFKTINGSYLGSAVSITIFVTLFPVLFLFAGIAGFIFARDALVLERLIEAVSLTPTSEQVLRDAASNATSSRSGSSIIGVLGLLWSASAIPRVLQYVLDATWGFTDSRSFSSNIKLIGWGIGGFLILLVSFLFSTIIGKFDGGLWLDALGTIFGLCIDFIFWMWLFTSLSRKRESLTAYIPGSLFGVFTLEAVKLIAQHTPNLLSGSSQAVGTLGASLALISSLLIIGKGIALASTINYVFHKRKHGEKSVV